MDAFEEKRKFRRIESSFPLKYRDLNKTEIDSRGTISKNFSEGGIRFRSDRFISLACRMVVELNLPAIAKPIRAVSKITWIRKLPTGDDYEVGNQFLEIAREDKEIIRDFVKDQAQEVSSI
ncbi:MAG: PilZ domain-containing protein [Omnitrophica bacterium]|nr:PilZ domain-containing protein [Candidatus Omnitrophota bacterium]